MNERENIQERILRGGSGMAMLILSLVVLIACIAGIVQAIFLLDGGQEITGGVLLGVALVVLCIGEPLLVAGLKVIRPGEALVLTLFGRYYGTLKKEGFYYVNPFAVGINPVRGAAGVEKPAATLTLTSGSMQAVLGGGKKVSLKAMTLNNGKQKINDLLGNPVEIGVVVVWRVQDTAKAVFAVDHYEEFLSIQCDSVLRNIVRLYPYDVADGVDADEKSLRGSSQEVAESLKSALQEKVLLAGLEILEARITHLAYAPEIAAAMLQRQQAAAIIDARKMIVDGAVGMVEMALEKLGEGGMVRLDEERTAAMVSNLLVVLCGNRDAQPVVNSGSLY